jgi:hypothetical protein
MALLEREDSEKEYARLADEMLEEERAATEGEQRHTISELTAAELERLAGLMRTQRQLQPTPLEVDLVESTPSQDADKPTATTNH